MTSTPRRCTLSTENIGSSTWLDNPISCDVKEGVRTLVYYDAPFAIYHGNEHIKGRFIPVFTITKHIVGGQREVSRVSHLDAAKKIIEHLLDILQLEREARYVE